MAKISFRVGVCLAVAVGALGAGGTVAQQAAAPTLTPRSLARVGTVSERYQSYNIEMLEVTGGRFWKPYADKSTPPPADAATTPAGMSADMYAYRAPKDLTNPRLRMLAAALGPAFVRVSGTWANSTYFPAKDETVTAPPPGFNGVLTRAQWQGVIDFARAAHAEIVTSFATSAGARDASGTWSPAQAERFVAATRAMGGRIAAAEFMNEPTFASMGGAPKGYDAAQYGKDFAVFHAWARANLPSMLIAGPGSVGESTGGSLAGTMPGFLPTPQLLQAMGQDDVDVFSYHAYAGVSERCKSMGPAQQTTPQAALSEQWLARTDAILAFYKAQRDHYDPGKPLWLTETAETACGGNPWSSTFLDTFRYLDQLGRLARAGVQTVMHNTLAASDYALLDETTYEPRPTYWAALLWHRLMGTTVLDAAVPLQPGLHVYAHCLRNVPGGVALLVIQNDTGAPHSLALPIAGERYTLSATELQARTVALNNHPLSLAAHDALPNLTPIPSPAGITTFAPATITFIALPNAQNPACR